MSSEDVRMEFEGQLEAQRRGAPERASEARFDPPYMPELVRKYLELVGPTTSAATVFHYASFMTVAALVLGPHLTLDGNPRFRPNLYTLLLGPSRFSHKSTPMDYALSLLPETGVPHFYLRGVVSIEGMAKQVTDRVRPRLMLHEDELANLCASQARGATGNVFPRLCELHGLKPSFELNGKEAVKLIEPFTCFLAGVTAPFLRTREARAAAGLGFFNRCFVVCGTASRPLDDWAWPPEAEMKQIAGKLGDLARALGEKPVPYAWAPSARARRKQWLDHWYEGAVARANSDAPFNPESNNLLTRLALLTAALDGAKEIRPEHTEHAIAVIDATESAALAAMDLSASNADRECEAWCEEHIPLGMTTIREIQKSAHRSPSTTDIVKVVRAWETVGRAKMQKNQGKRGRPGVYVTRFW